MLEVGQRMPAFAQPSTLGRMLTSEELRGRWLVVYFFPKAFTPNCTREAKFFQNNALELHALGAEVIGVSRDQLPTQCEFAEKLGATYPLLADDGRMTRDFGVMWPVIPLIRRVTFVIDPEQVVRQVFHHEHQIVKAFDPVLKFVRQSVAEPRPA